MYWCSKLASSSPVRLPAARTEIISAEEQADERATTWSDGRGWVHLACVPGFVAPHWHVEPKDEDEFPELEQTTIMEDDMPWTTGDVDGFKKGLSDEDKAKWVAIANAVLADGLAKGGKQSEFERMGIMTANART